MDYLEFRTACKKVGFDTTTTAGQIGASKFLGVTDRTIRHWSSGKIIPNAVAIALTLMAKFRIAPDQALKIAGRDDWYEKK